MSKIVILNGSPRKNGNTAALVREFIKGAEESGNEVVHFQLSDMNIHGCISCYRGNNSREFPCTQRDDMDKIYPHVRDCNVIVLASPMYYWNISGYLKNCIDRLFALEEGYVNILRGHGRGSVLLMPAFEHDYDACAFYYKNLAKNLGWKDLGWVLAGGNCMVGDINGKPVLKEAYELGKSIQ